MFSGEIDYTDPLIQLTKSLVKHNFSLHNNKTYKISLFCFENRPLLFCHRDIPTIIHNGYCVTPLYVCIVIQCVA